MEKLILEKLEQSETGRERFVTTDLNVLKAVRELGNQDLVQWKVKMQPAQPLGLIVHDDQLNTLSDWAEKMVCQIIGAEQTAWNCKGYDGVLADGTKIEIKLASWYNLNTNPATAFENIAGNEICDLMIGVLFDGKTISQSEFFVLTNDVIKEFSKTNKVRKRIAFSKNSRKHKELKKFECTLAELVELKHGYEHFLKMKGKVEPIEPPKESIQYVIDVWKPNRFNLMPYDKRYEDSSWYAEFAVAQLLGGTVTEQRCAGYDVLMDDGLKVQVKRAKRSVNNRRKDGSINYVYKFGNITKDADYDILVGLFWYDFEEAEKSDLDTVTILIMPKDIAFKMKTKYRSNQNETGFIKIWKDPKQFKLFFFTIDHLVELKELGYEQFYLKYLKEPCEKVLGAEIKNGSDDSNGNKIDLKPKFPIQFQSSKRTNQADQRSA